MSSKRPNKIVLWRDFMLYLGDSFDPEMHRHHAVQCCIALKGEMRISSQDSDAWTSCSSTVIPSNVRHRIANPEGAICILYLEKTSRDYRSILDFRAVSGTPENRLEPLVSNEPVPRALMEELLAALSKPLESNAANALRAACLQFLQGKISPKKDMDPRISILLAKLHEGPGQLSTGQELASLIGLSESRMQHLFKEELGVPIRRYVLWMKIRYVVELAVSGSSLTAAAHASGFSDLAHFTRTFRAMFGIKPSALLGAGSGLVPLLCDRP